MTNRKFKITKKIFEIFCNIINVFTSTFERLISFNKKKTNISDLKLLKRLLFFSRKHDKNHKKHVGAFLKHVRAIKEHSLRQELINNSAVKIQV